LARWHPEFSGANHGMADNTMRLQIVEVCRCVADIDTHRLLAGCRIVVEERGIALFLEKIGLADVQLQQEGIAGRSEHFPEPENIGASVDGSVPIEVTGR